MKVDANILRQPDKEDFSKLTFGERLRAIRKARGFSQDDLAKKVGIHRNMISNYERDITIPTVSRLEWFCKALGVSASDLLGF